MFDKLIWHHDRLLLGDLVFRLEHHKDANWDLGEDCFSLYKTKPLFDQYAKYWASQPAFRPQNIMELGLWDGGSLVLWFEHFRPVKHVGIDIQKRDSSRYFTRYLETRGVADRIKPYWGIDQADTARLHKIIAAEFGAPIDLVIDDASHMYSLTKASFEALFPLLRPGGLYIIEDWAWAHWKEFQAPAHPWHKETPLTKLVIELIEAVGSAIEVDGCSIATVTTYQGFVVIERSGVESSKAKSFRVDRLISRGANHHHY